jgi:hypothetical protein
VPPETQTDRRWGALWVWAEDDVEDMVERAGFTDVTIRYARAWGSDPLSRSLIKIWERFGVDMREGRIVSAVKQ